MTTSKFKRPERCSVSEDAKLIETMSNTLIASAKALETGAQVLNVRLETLLLSECTAYNKALVKFEQEFSELPDQK